MNKKFLILALVLFLIGITAVSAGDNQTILSTGDSGVVSLSETDTLEKTYFYDADTGKQYVDDTVVTHNVVKYYGDKDTKFRVKVYDSDYNPEEGVYVSFGKQFTKYREKTTDANGVVYFPINYNVGSYNVETYIESEDGESSWSAYNTVKIKSTIPTKELVKYSTSKKKFKIRFLDVKGHALKNTFVKIAVKGKVFKLKTDLKGYIKIKLNFKAGKYKVTAYNPVSGEKRKIPLVILKKGLHKINIRVDDPTGYFPTKKLKNGDVITSCYESKKGRQYLPGVYIQADAGGLENAKHTKVLKAKFFFKNKSTGKIITKTSTNVKYNGISVKPVKGYSPFKATVWYRDK